MERGEKGRWKEERREDGREDKDKRDRGGEGREDRERERRGELLAGRCRVLYRYSEPLHINEGTPLSDLTWESYPHLDGQVVIARINHSHANTLTHTAHGMVFGAR